MLYVIVIFTYFIGSVSFVVALGDKPEAPKPKQDGVELSEGGIDALHPEVGRRTSGVTGRYLRLPSTGATSPTKTAERMSAAPTICTAMSLSPASQ